MDGAGAEVVEIVPNFSFPKNRCNMTFMIGS